MILTTELRKYALAAKAAHDKCATPDAMKELQEAMRQLQYYFGFETVLEMLDRMEKAEATVASLNELVGPHSGNTILISGGVMQGLVFARFGKTEANTHKHSVYGTTVENTVEQLAALEDLEEAAALLTGQV